jgi:cell division protein FtsQ
MFSSKKSRKYQGQARRTRPKEPPIPKERGFYLKKILVFITYVLLIAIVLGLIELGIFLKSKYNDIPIEKIKVIASYEHVDQKVLQEIITPSVSDNRASFFGLDIVGLKRQILQLPWVKGVYVKRVWPGTIEITVEEQKALANWKNAQLVNEAGDLFSPPKETFPKNLPLFSAPQDYVKTVLHEYFVLQNILQKLNWEIAGLDLDDTLSWHISLNNGVNIFLGSNDIEKKLQDFIELYPNIQSDGKHNKIRSVDLRYTSGFAVKWNDNKIEILLNFSGMDPRQNHSGMTKNLKWND